MKEGPDIAAIAQLIGDPARANMLAALMSGKALTATELAFEAGVTPQTASSHLARMTDGGLVSIERQGRHRYVSLAGPEVAETLEALMGLAAGQGRLRTRTGPSEPALRQARSCYKHLAGEMGVVLYEALVADGTLQLSGDGVDVSGRGRTRLEDLGIDFGTFSHRQPLARTCLDWSMRRPHLGGALARGLLARFYDLGWAKPAAEGRAVVFNPAGRKAFEAEFLGQ